MVCLPCCSTVCFYVFGNFWESKVRRPPTINKEIKGVVLKPPRPRLPPRPLDFCAICFFRTPKLPQFTISANHAHNCVCRRRLPCLAHHNTGYETEHTHVVFTKQTVRDRLRSGLVAILMAPTKNASFPRIFLGRPEP